MKVDKGKTQNLPIRILHVIGIMNRGGAETMIMNLYRHIDRSRVQFDFVEHTEGKAAFDDEIRELGGEIYHCPRFTGLNALAYRKWWKTFFHKHSQVYTIVHGHIGSTAAFYLAEAKKVGIYTVAHSHSAAKERTFHGALYRAFSYPTRFIADTFFGCSKDAGISRYGRRANSERFVLLKNGIDTRTFLFDTNIRAEVQRELNIDDSDLVVGHVGRFEYPKNHLFLLECFKKLCQMRGNSILLLVGSGSFKERIQNFIVRNNLQDRVILTGEREDIYRLLQAMDVFVFPSLYEGLPVTLVEAQTSGLPCVISETITDQAILIKDLVRKESLKSKPEIWCRDILEMAGKERYDRSAEVRDKGYDIHTTARWLEEFYLDKAVK